jgi:hypothetical protein
MPVEVIGIGVFSVSIMSLLRMSVHLAPSVYFMDSKTITSKASIRMFPSESVVRSSYGLESSMSFRRRY